MTVTGNREKGSKSNALWKLLHTLLESPDFHLWCPFLLHSASSPILKCVIDRKMDLTPPIKRSAD